MRTIKIAFKVIFLLVVLPILVACGGGGGGESTPSTPETDTPVDGGGSSDNGSGAPVDGGGGSDDGSGTPVDGGGSSGNGGSGDGTPDDGSSLEKLDTTHNPLSSDSFNVNEEDFDDTSNWVQLQGKSNNPIVNLSNKSNGFNITSAEITNVSAADIDPATQYRYPTTVNEETVTNNIGKPLYIDEEFAGVVESFDDGSIVVRNAVSISEAYKHFEIEATNDEMIQEVKRSIKNSIGAYDAQNEHPIKVSFVKKDIQTKLRTLTQEPVIVIEFPKGYKIPLKPTKRSVDVNIDCELSDAMCDADFNYNKKYEKDFEVTKEFGEVTFTTDGSKVEIGLGAYIRAMYDYEVVGSNNYYFEFQPSIYYLVNLEMSITGKSITAAEETFDIVENGLDIKIPLHKLVQLNLNIKPEIVIGMESANSKEVEFTAKLNSKRTGYVKLVYANGKGSFSKGLKEENDPLLKTAITAKLDTGTDKVVGYLFPEIAVRPQLSFTKIDKKINIAYVRNGVRIDTKIKGIIDDNWIIENTEVSGSTQEDVYLKTFLYGLIDFKWDIKVGDYDIWSSDNWTQLYKSNEFKILEWMSQRLHEPKIITLSTAQQRYVSFDILSNLKDYIRFYYTIDGTDIVNTTINDDRDNTPYKMWKYGDEQIVFSEDKVVKVKAVVFTDEITEKDDTLWRWGMSSSKQAERGVVYLPSPSITPISKDFLDTTTIKATETEGNMIQYSDNGSLSYKDCGVGSCSKTVSKTTELAFRTMKTMVVDGEDKEFYSDNVLGSYRKCPGHETLDEGGSCVTQCPYLWDITASVDLNLESKDSNASTQVIGTSSFLNVLIYPRCDFSLNLIEWDACKAYMHGTFENSGKRPNSYDYDSHFMTTDNPDPSMLSAESIKNSIASYNARDDLTGEGSSSYEGTYRWTSSGSWYHQKLSEDGELGHYFKYSGTSPSGLCTRDPYPETPLSQLPAAYEDYYVNTDSYDGSKLGDSNLIVSDQVGEDGEFMNGIHPDHSQDVFAGIDSDSMQLTVEEDIFGEILAKKAFSVSNTDLTLKFKPRKYKAPANAEDETDLCALYGYGCDDTGTDGDSGDGNNSDDDEDNGANVDGEYDDYKSLWKFQLDYSHKLFSVKGGMIVKNFYIELAPTSIAGPGDYIFVGNDYASYPEGTEINFSGNLHYDDGVSPLLMSDAQFMAPLTKVIQFSAMLDSGEEGAPWSQIGSGEIAGMPGCDGHLPSGSTKKIFENEVITWTVSDEVAICIFTLSPCTDALCE